VVIRALIISFALPVLAATNGRQASVVRALFIKGTRLALNSDLTLTSLQRTFGPTALVAPRHHDDPWSECYSALDSIGPFTIRLQSDELGGPEHVLLGLIRLGQGTAITVLRKMGLDLENVRAEVEKLVGTGPDQKLTAWPPASRTRPSGTHC